MKNTLLILVIALISAQVLAAQYVETTDTGNTLPTAQTLPAGTTSVVGSISDVFDVDLFKFNSNFAAATYTIGGTVSGMTGTGLILQNNAGDDLVINSNGSFTFPMPLEGDDNYTVTVKTQPSVPTQFCNVLKGSGTLSDTEADFTIEVLETDGLDMNLLIFNSAGQGIAGDDDNESFCSPVTLPGEYDSCLTLTLTSGDYYFAVGDNDIGAFETLDDLFSSYFFDNDSGILESPTVENIGLVSVEDSEGNETGDYEVNFSRALGSPGNVKDVAVICGQHVETPDAGDTRSTAQEFPAETTSIRGEVSDGFDVDMFKFELHSATALTIEALNTDGLDMNLLVFNSAGQGLAGDDDNDSDCTPVTVVTGYDSCLTLQLPAGEYYFAVGDDNIGAFESLGDFFDSYFFDNDSGILEIPTIDNIGLVGVEDSVGNGTGGYVINFSQSLGYPIDLDTHTIGGDVTGLLGSGLVLQNNALYDLPVAVDGNFIFATPLDDGSDYVVTVMTQPTSPSQTCSVSNGSGTLDGANISNVSVTCSTDTFTVGGSVTGLSGSGLVLQNSGGDDEAIASNGAFTFDTPLADGSGYAVTVKTQPTSPTQVCSVSNGSGTLAGVDITDVAVSCSTNTNNNELSNIATRADVGTGDDIAIAGFIITGNSQKCVIVRGRGPSVGVPVGETRLPDPTLTLKSGQTTIAENDNWTQQNNPDHVAIIEGLGKAPGDLLDAAIYICLDPGAYTVFLRGYLGTTGVGIAEVLDVDDASPYLRNIATRARVGTGNLVTIAGFIITGNTPKQILIRGRGPSVGVPAGVTRLADPTLTLKSGQTTIGSNDNWEDAANAADISATGKAPGDPLDSAIMMVLEPGAYTAILRGAGGTTGVGIVEVLDLTGRQ